MTSRTVIGFVGFGDVPDRLLRQMLADQVDAAHGAVRFVIPLRVIDFSQAMQFVVDWAVENKVSYEVVVETAQVLAETPESMLPKTVLAARMTQAVDVMASLSRILEAGSPSKLLVFWHPDDGDAHQVIARALEHDIEVRDLCAALARIGRLPITKEEAVAVTDVPLYADEDLDAMVDDEEGQLKLASIAEIYEIPHNDIGTWEEVRDLVKVAQRALTTEADGTADEDTTSEENTTEAVTHDYPEGEMSLAELEAMGATDPRRIDEMLRANKLLVLKPDGTRYERPPMAKKIQALWEYQNGPLVPEATPELPEALVTFIDQQREFNLELASTVSQILTTLVTVGERVASGEGNIASQYEETSRKLDGVLKAISDIPAPLPVPSIAKRVAPRI